MVNFIRAVEQKTQKMNTLTFILDLMASAENMLRNNVYLENITGIFPSLRIVGTYISEIK